MGRDKNVLRLTNILKQCNYNVRAAEQYIIRLMVRRHG